MLVLAIAVIFCGSVCLNAWLAESRLEPGQVCNSGGPEGLVERISGTPRLTLIPYGYVCRYTDITGQLPTSETYTDLGTPFFLVGAGSATALATLAARRSRHVGAVLAPRHTND